MTEHLRESEWLTINTILLELYKVESQNAFMDKVMKVFRMLVPYTKGYFVILDEEGQIDREHMAFVEIDDRKYVDRFFEKDYLQYVFDAASETCTYRDTDILEERIRVKTEVYTEFLKPNDIPYGAGILFMREGRVEGIMNLFRSSRLGDFTDKDIFILETLKHHIFSRLLSLQKQDSLQVQPPQKRNLPLTEREWEVSRLILEGADNEEIGRRLSISISTVKKHVNNIYGKTGVKNRVQLARLIEA